MPKIVFDASSLVGALLKRGSAPERALLIARTRERLCLSRPVESEIREVFGRTKFKKYLTPGRVDRILDLLLAAALVVEPTVSVIDCRDPKDNKYLELALAAQAAIIVTSDADLLSLDPWHGVRIITPAEYVRRYERGGDPPSDVEL